MGKIHSLEVEAAQLLASVWLIPPSHARLSVAASIDPDQVRSLDAIHLATATELHGTGTISALLTYDRQLTAGCAHRGIPVVAPVV
jgi:predicted nucleic acid-binding protein